jgi:hypothetical protein
MLVLLPMTSTLVKYRGCYSDFNRPFKISSAHFRCFLSGRNHRHFQQPLSLGEGANMCCNDVRNVRSWQVKCVWRFPHVNSFVFLLQSHSRLDISNVANYSPCAEKLVTKVGQRFYFETGRIFLFVLSCGVCSDRTQCASREPSLRIKLMDENSNVGKLSSLSFKP